jgi:hypothetical protein
MVFRDVSSLERPIVRTYQRLVELVEWLPRSLHFAGRDDNVVQEETPRLTRDSGAWGTDKEGAGQVDGARGVIGGPPRKAVPTQQREESTTKQKEKPHTTKGALRSSGKCAALGVSTANAPPQPFARSAQTKKTATKEGYG